MCSAYNTYPNFEGNFRVKKSVITVYVGKYGNLFLQSGSFPSSWCKGSVTPIFKSGVYSDSNNYRGICASSCLGKFFCSILNQRLSSFIEETNILHNSQIGFMPNHRTSAHIFT